MDTFDLIIIYLACGSPFGVYQLTRRDYSGSPLSWVLVISSFIFWPVIGVVLLWHGLDRRKDGKLPAYRIEKVRSDIERIAFANLPAAALFEFRDVYYRYTGLVEAAAGDEGSSIGAGLIEVSGYDQSAAAAKCLARRNRKKLEFHKVLARNEFVELISEAAGNSPNFSQIVALASGLANDLGDCAAAEDFAALASVRRPAPITSEVEPEGELWRSRIPSTSNIS